MPPQGATAAHGAAVWGSARGDAARARGRAAVRVLGPRGDRDRRLPPRGLRRRDRDRVRAGRAPAGATAGGDDRPPPGPGSGPSVGSAGPSRQESVGIVSEPSTAVRPPSGAVLTATKIEIPGVRTGLVPRARLVELLTGATEAKLALIQAPAGSGKTTLLDRVARGGEGDATVRLAVARSGRQRPGAIPQGVIAAMQDGRPARRGAGARASRAGRRARWTSCSRRWSTTSRAGRGGRPRPRRLPRDRRPAGARGGDVPPRPPAADAAARDRHPGRAAAAGRAPARPRRARRGPRRRPALHRRRGRGAAQRRARRSGSTPTTSRACTGAPRAGPPGSGSPHCRCRPRGPAGLHLVVRRRRPAGRRLPRVRGARRPAARGARVPALHIRSSTG